jgi:hypothetical protein
MARKPNEKEISDWLQEDTTKYLLDVLVKKTAEFDTIRDLNESNYVEKLGEKKAIELIENIFIEFYSELPKLQDEVGRKEFNIVKSLKEFKGGDY